MDDYLKKALNINGENSSVITPEFMPRFLGSIVLEGFQLAGKEIETWESLGFSDVNESQATGRSGRGFMPESYSLEQGTIHEKSEQRYINKQSADSVLLSQDFSEKKIRKKEKFSLGVHSYSKENMHDSIKQKTITEKQISPANSNSLIQEPFTSQAAELKNDFDALNILSQENHNDAGSLDKSAYSQNKYNKLDPDSSESKDRFVKLNHHYSSVPCLVPLADFQYALDNNKRLRIKIEHLEKDENILHKKKLQLLAEIKETAQLKLASMKATTKSESAQCFHKNSKGVLQSSDKGSSNITSNTQQLSAENIENINHSTPFNEESIAAQQSNRKKTKYHQLTNKLKHILHPTGIKTVNYSLDHELSKYISYLNNDNKKWQAIPIDDAGGKALNFETNNNESNYQKTSDSSNHSQTKLPELAFLSSRGVNEEVITKFNSILLKLSKEPRTEILTLLNKTAIEDGSNENNSASNFTQFWPNQVPNIQLDINKTFPHNSISLKNDGSLNLNTSISIIDALKEQGEQKKANKNNHQRFKKTSNTYLEQFNSIELEGIKHQGNLGRSSSSLFSLFGAETYDKQSANNQSDSLLHVRAKDNHLLTYIDSLADDLSRNSRSNSLADKIGCSGSEESITQSEMGIMPSSGILPQQYEDVSFLSDQVIDDDALSQVKVKVGRVTYSETNANKKRKTSFKRPKPSMRLTDYNHKEGRY